MRAATEGMLALLIAVQGCQGSGREVGAAVSPNVNRSGERYDPVTMDPATVDTAYPPLMAEIAFKSGGERLNGLLYLPAGAGPHPVVFLLHGNPGNERNLDLAQAIRRAGYTAFFFDYRGNWGSGGTFSRTHALEDVRAALAWVRSPASVKQFRIDSSRVVLVGHSMGGWLALMTAAADPSVRCVGALDSRNVGAYGRLLRHDRSVDSALVAVNNWLTAPGAPYRAEAGGAGLVKEMKANAEDWDITAHARTLSDRPVLLVAATFKPDQDSLVAALSRVGGHRVTALAWHTDHSYSDRRVALARTVVGWLRSSCAL
jgi:uncharacterized protein